MIKLSHFLKNSYIYLFALLLLFTNACSSGFNTLLSELIQINNNVLSQDSFNIEIKTEIKSEKDKKVSTNIEYIDKFYYDGRQCFSHTTADNLGTYYVDNYYYVHNSYSSCSYGLEINTNDIIMKLISNDVEGSKVSIRKIGNKYTVTYEDFSALFNILTNNRYASEIEKGDVKLPKKMRIVETVKNGLLQSEKSSYSFKIYDTKYDAKMSATYTYKSDKTLPEPVINAVAKREEDNLYINCKKDFVKEISYENKGSTPPFMKYRPQDENGNNNYYQLFDCANPCTISCDGTKYIIISSEFVFEEKSRLHVYDAYTFKLLYTVTFNKPLNQEYYCANGRISISLEVGWNNQSSTPINTNYCTYLLDDFSKIDKESSNTIDLSKNDIYFSSLYPTRYNSDYHYDYALKGDFSSAIVSSNECKYLNHKYDYVTIRFIDENKNEEQFWLYDKENNSFVAQSYLYNLYDGCIFNEHYFLGYDRSFSQVAFINIIQ